MLHRFLAIFITAGLLFTAPCLAEAAKPVEFKLGIVVGDGHPYTVSAFELKKRVEKLTGGRIIVHVFHSGQLSGSERELIEGLQIGTCDITIPATGPVAGFEKGFFLFNFPYLFKDLQTGYKCLDGPIGDELAKSLEKHRIKLIGWWVNGMYAFTNSKREVKTVEDIKGLKIRCMENSMHLAVYKAWGAVPTPMAFGEVVTALQQGTADGQENADASIYANKYYEVQKYLTLSYHYFMPAPFLIAKGKYDGLPDDLRALFQQAVDESVTFQRAEYERQAKLAVDNMQAKGMIVTYPDVESFKKASLSVYPEFLKQLGPDVKRWVEQIQSEQ